MKKIIEKIKKITQPNVSGVQCFEEKQLMEKAYDSKDRGIQIVDLKQIVGSVGRYHDFDDEFRLKHHMPSERFQQVKSAMERGKSIPPVKLYQIKNQYYVLDGNHRVAAAKALGRENIRAQILEFIPSKKTLDNILYNERMEFIEKTGIEQVIELTEVEQYTCLLNQIKTHHLFLQGQESESITYEAAANDWYNTIYKPLTAIIIKGKLINSFPNRTIDDLYTYISSHQWETGHQRHYGPEIEKLIPKDMELFRSNMLDQKIPEYSEMQSEITFFVLMNVFAKKEFKIIEKLFALKEVQEIHSVHGSVDILAKIVLKRDLLESDAAIISYFIHNQVRKVPGVTNTQTLIPGYSKIR